MTADLHHGGERADVSRFEVTPGWLACSILKRPPVFW